MAEKGGTKQYSVLIVDDHPVVREGLARAIEGQPDFTVCGEAEDRRNALKIASEEAPDLAIVDLSLKGESGLELVRDLAARYPKLGVLVLSMHDEGLYAERCLRAGAKGYIMKDGGMEKVVEALRSVRDGRVYLSEAMSGRLLQRMVSGSPDASSSPVEALSDRELEVFEMIGTGMGTREIADALHLSVKTIETHRENIKHKLKLDSAIELHQHAFLWVQNEQQGTGLRPQA